MAKHMTVEELEAFVKFYSSSVGKSVWEKFPKMVGEMMPVTQGRVRIGVSEGIKEYKRRKGIK